MPAFAWFLVGYAAGVCWMLFVVSLCRAAAEADRRLREEP